MADLAQATFLHNLATSRDILLYCRFRRSKASKGVAMER